MEKIKEIKRKASKSMAWLTYTVIIFEMLYMSSPLAVFFYSVYKAPLKLLNSTPKTSWLVQNVLPHFTQTKSILINTLLYISWPLMGLGMAVFIIGFIQIYWAKFQKSGAVTGGLYRYIRHPQYTGWAIFGLGMAIFWSRMIVILAYVSMLFVYFLLAKAEEQECLEKFGKDYGNYLRKTGRFLPKLLKTQNGSSPGFFPNHGWKRTGALALSYCFIIICVIILGLGMRTYSLSEISHMTQINSAILSLSPMNEGLMARILFIANAYIDSSDELKTLISPPGTKQLIYIIPLEWHVPELAMDREVTNHGHGTDPTSHGNPADFDPYLYKLLFSLPNVAPNTPASEILLKASMQKPILIIKVDLKKEQVIGIDRPPRQGKYSDIPVPIF
jgi:protein-S-isoprenylcysteine O-methyltransferase Ste14